MIRIKNLSYVLNGKEILKNINLEIKKNCITGILGANGSGKTTLLKHLVRELPSKNSIYIEDRNIEKIGRKEFARKIAFVEQSANTIGEISVEETVMMGRYPYKKPFLDYGSEDKKIVEEVIADFKLEELKEKKIGNLSGGELKRTFIAKAVAQQTDIIVLDEPINHLDIKYQLSLMNFLKGMKDKTIIFSIHNIDLALKFCDEIILIKSGEVIESGKTMETLTSDKIKTTFGVDTMIRRVEGEDIVIYKK